jgi:hypothetical protein
MTGSSGHAGEVLGDGPYDDGLEGDGGVPRAGAGPEVGQAVSHGGAVRAGGPGSAAEVDGGPKAEEVAEAWLSGLADQVSVPASEVQDHLLDLWGALDEGPARVEVERWLTETLRRNLYSVSDINERLESLLPTG